MLAQISALFHMLSTYRCTFSNNEEESEEELFEDELEEEEFVEEYEYDDKRELYTTFEEVSEDEYETAKTQVLAE